jgi:hypothetical protein
MKRHLKPANNSCRPVLDFDMPLLTLAGFDYEVEV